MRDAPSHAGSLTALAATTFLSWGVLYYAFPVLAPVVSTSTGWPPQLLAAIYAGSLVVAAVVGLGMGKVIDQVGNLRRVVPWFSMMGSAGLLIAATGSLWAFVLGWAMVGAAQAGTLWGPAFIAITRWFSGRPSARPMMLITAIGGSASLFVAPLVAWLVTQFDWHATLVILGIGYAVIVLPVEWFGLRATWRMPAHEATVTSRQLRSTTRQGRFVLLQICMFVTGVALFSVTLNLVSIATERGATYYEAAFIFGLVGLGQVLGRVFMSIIPLPKTPGTRLLTLMLVAAASLALLALAPPVLALAAMATVAGAVRGWHTLMMRNGVLERWGESNFGAIMARFNLPVALGIALSPLIGASLSSVAGGYLNSVLISAAAVAVAAIVARRT